MRGMQKKRDGLRVSQHAQPQLLWSERLGESQTDNPSEGRIGNVRQFKRRALHNAI